MLLFCGFCKKEVPYPHYQNQRYCNKKCRYEAMKLRHNKKSNWNKEKMCILCDKNFIPISANQKFCSSVCAKKTVDFDFVHKNYSFLKEKIEKLNNRWLKTRIVIFDRDNFICKYCGRSPMKSNDVILHIDHKIPKEKGGTDNLDNLITSCAQCNLGKGDLLLNYWKNL